MSKMINEIGNIYTYLTVLERDGSDARGSALWLCECKCGNLVRVTGNHLRSGATKSCGCYQKEQTSKAVSKDLVGQTIGNFTVLDSVIGQKNGPRHKWRCRCNLCGREDVYIATNNLNHQESCGCLIESKGVRKIKDILNANNIYYIQEKRFIDLIFPDTKCQARFDFFVDNKYIIEYDGRQHFIQGSGIYDNEEKFIRTQDHDIIKNNYCQEHNIPIIRIPYTELDNITLDMLQPETSPYLI